MEARLLPPRENYSGNLVWRKDTSIEKAKEISASLEKIRSLGYWASAFPEGDGVTFKYESETHDKSNVDMLADFRSSFAWIHIELANSKDSNLELAELEGEGEGEGEDEGSTLDCIVIVPIEKIYIQKTLSVGNYIFFCARQFDLEPWERLSEHKGAYLQFNCLLTYADLLKLNQTIDHNDYLINKCLSIAEHALDLVRYSHSSFMVRERTPNPAGQSEDGFYDVEIIPLGKTHLKPVKLSGISRPLSVSNNWLGPQVDDFCGPGVQYLSAIYDKTIENELSASVIGALRSCRQSFYSIGEESQFLNLIFTLDGLANIEKNWVGWKHRTYIAALVCNSSLSSFKKILEDYDSLYVDVRNKLVHEGKDFYEITQKSNFACEAIFTYIKNIVELIENREFATKSNLTSHATNLLKQEQYRLAFQEVIDRVSSTRGKIPQYPSW